MNLACRNVSGEGFSSLFSSIILFEIDLGQYPRRHIGIGEERLQIRDLLLVRSGNEDAEHCAAVLLHCRSACLNGFPHLLGRAIDGAYRKEYWALQISGDIGVEGKGLRVVDTAVICADYHHGFGVDGCDGGFICCDDIGTRTVLVMSRTFRAHSPGLFDGFADVGGIKQGLGEGLFLAHGRAEYAGLLCGCQSPDNAKRRDIAAIGCFGTDDGYGSKTHVVSYALNWFRHRVATPL